MTNVIFPFQEFGYDKEIQIFPDPVVQKEPANKKNI